MGINQDIDKLNALMKYAYYGETLYHLDLPKAKGERGRGWLSGEKMVIEMLSGEDEPIFTGLAFEEFMQYHRRYFYHFMITDGLTDNGKAEFTHAAAYGYLSTAFDYSYRRLGILTLTSFDDVVLRLHLLIRAGWWDEAREMTHWLVEDFHKNDEDQMVLVETYTTYVARMMWFILRLSAINFDCSLKDSHYLDLNKIKEEDSEWKIYASILDDWNTTNLKRLDQGVSLLCDLLIKHNMIGVNDKSNDDFDTILVNASLYPFAVLVWLKIREYHGLENPTKFSHPVMQHPYGTRFDEDLQRPQSLPYVNELSALVRKNEPTFQFPKHLKGLTE